MEQFPPNSQRSRTTPVSKDEDKKQVERVVQGDVIRRKKPLSKKFRETFFGGDTQGVFDYVFMDVLVPAAKDMFADAVSQGIERMVYGEVRSPHRRGATRGGPTRTTFTNYSGFSSSSSVRPREVRPQLSRRARAMHDFDEIILATRVEAEEVLTRLEELIDRYNQATVGDLYDMINVNRAPTDERYGWEDLRGAGVVRTKGGYLLDLPAPEQLP